MSSAAATNRVRQSHSTPDRGIAVNMAIPVAAVAHWKQEALRKVVGFRGLPTNWDAQGSRAPDMAVMQTAVEMLLNIPCESLPVPRVVPVSGGGFHFEWSVGDRELEISIEPNCRIEALRVENGMPLEEDPMKDLSVLFGWLASR